MHRLPRALTLRWQQQQQIQQHTLNTVRRARTPRIQTRAKSEYIYKPTGEPVRFQAVRFKKPGFFTFRRLVTIGIYTGVVYGYLNLLWKYMDVEIEFVEDEETVEQEDGKEAADGDSEEDEEEEEEDGPPFYASEESTFIPLTWSRKLPRSFYKGSDPEWQTFIAIARDKSKHKQIQDELVQIVYTGSVQHPSISRQLGKDAKVGKYWLDISFPDGPPQEFERSGIEIGDGFIAWSQQRVSPEQQWRLMRALWPEAAAQGSWAAMKVLAGIQYRRMKQALGLEGVDPMAPEERFRTAMEMMGKGKAQTEPDGQPGNVAKRADNSSSYTTSDGSRPRATPSSTSDPERKIPWLPTLPLPLPSSSNASNNDNSQTPAPETSLDVPIAMHVFQSTLSKSWNPKKTEPPRGSFVVQGLVEVRGQRGRMLFDVSSAYDPKSGKYVHVNAGVRGFKRWSQAPRGGP